MGTVRNLFLLIDMIGIPEMLMTFNCELSLISLKYSMRIVLTIVRVSDKKSSVSDFKMIVEIVDQFFLCLFMACMDNLMLIPYRLLPTFFAPV